MSAAAAGSAALRSLWRRSCRSAATRCSAQFAMPDPKQMSGIPRPVDRPARTAPCRCASIRGELSNNIPDQPVELLVDGKAQTVKTDDERPRRVQSRCRRAPRVKAVTVVDGERLESQEFPSPAQGGIRLMLVATDKAKEAAGRRGGQRAGRRPAQVVLGGESRIVIEPGDEALDGLLPARHHQHRARAGEPADAVRVRDAAGALSGTAVMRRIVAAGERSPARRVTVAGPFPPGSTFVQVGYSAAGHRRRRSTSPRRFRRRSSSSRVDRQEGRRHAARRRRRSTGSRRCRRRRQLYIAAAGGAVPAGQPLRLTLVGPAASQRDAALGRAGVWRRRC